MKLVKSLTRSVRVAPEVMEEIKEMDWTLQQIIDCWIDQNIEIKTLVKAKEKN